jgi:hypothetical protein
LRITIFLGKYEIVPISICPKFKTGLPRCISPEKISLRNGSGAHQPEINKDVRAGEGDEMLATEPDIDNGVMTSPERPHRPWLVPGAGRL